MATHRSDTSRELVTLGNMEDGEAERSRRAPRRVTRVVLAVRAYWHEFCNSTSLHGLQYLGDLRRPFAERVWWAVSLLVSVLVCGYFIAKLYRKWEVSPVIVTFAESPTPIWQIPFPAVTVCTEIKVKRSVFDFTRAMFDIKSKNFTPEQEENFEYASILCDFIAHKEGNKTLDHDQVVQHIEKFAPSVNDFMNQCKLKGRHVDCAAIFAPVLTDEGLCFTFNALRQQELLRDDATTTHLSENTTSMFFPRNATWSLEGGYLPVKDGFGSGLRSYPHRSQSSGKSAGLSFEYQAKDVDVDAWCRWPTTGLKVLLHSPVDFPQVGTQFFRAPLNRDVVVGVRPSLMNTSNDLRDYSPAARQCYFSHERQLRYFKIYTQKNCQLECLANFTLDRCRCIPFYMPHSESDPMCGSGSNHCTSFIAEGLANNGKALRKCACDATCVEIKYDVETSQSHFVWYKILETKQLQHNDTEYKSMKVGHISIYFKEMHFITSVRSELYGLADFMANCGGLLGLFMGFSFLSLVEFIYFFTIRLYSNVRRRRHDKAKLRTV